MYLLVYGRKEYFFQNYSKPRHWIVAGWGCYSSAKRPAALLASSHAAFLAVAASSRSLLLLLLCVADFAVLCAFTACTHKCVYLMRTYGCISPCAATRGADLNKIIMAIRTCFTRLTFLLYVHILNITLYLCHRMNYSAPPSSVSYYFKCNI